MGEREGSRAKQMKPGGRVGGVEKDVGYGVQNEAQIGTKKCTRMKANEDRR